MVKSLKFYYDLLSPPSRALYVFLEKSKIPHEKVPIALRKGEHLSEEYEKNVNRFCKVPCINYNGFKLSESHAIANFLIREYNISEEFYPKEIHQQAAVDEFLSWTHNTLRMSAGLLFMEQWIYPIQNGKYGNPKTLETYRRELFKNLDLIESIWLKDKKFLAGNNMSIADIFASCDILQTRMCGINPFENRPNTEKWINSVKTILNPYFDDAHKFVYKYSEKYEGVPPIEK